MAASGPAVARSRSARLRNYETALCTAQNCSKSVRTRNCQHKRTRKGVPHLRCSPFARCAPFGHLRREVRCEVRPPSASFSSASSARFETAMASGRLIVELECATDGLMVTRYVEPRPSLRRRRRPLAAVDYRTRRARRTKPKCLLRPNESVNRAPPRDAPRSARRRRLGVCRLHAQAPRSKYEARRGRSPRSINCPIARGADDS
jgi:hypothetical protein